MPFFPISEVGAGFFLNSNVSPSLTDKASFTKRGVEIKQLSNSINFYKGTIYLRILPRLVLKIIPHLISAINVGPKLMMILFYKFNDNWDIIFSISYFLRKIFLIVKGSK